MYRQRYDIWDNVPSEDIAILGTLGLRWSRLIDACLLDYGRTKATKWTRPMNPLREFFFRAPSVGNADCNPNNRRNV